MADKMSAAEKRRNAFDTELDSYLSQRREQMRIEEEQKAERRRQEEARGTATPGSPNTRGRYRPLDETTEDSEQGILGALVDRIQSGLQRSAAGVQGTLADEAPMYARIGSTFGTIQDLARGDFSALERRLDPTQAALDDSRRLTEASAANERALAPAYNEFMGERGWLGKQATEAVFDVAGSPTGALSVFGGPVAGIGVADVYAQTYAEMRRQGFSPEEARTRAGMQATPEAIGFIPAGRFIERIPGVGAATRRLTSEVANRATRVGTRVATTALGEAAEEGLTEVLQTEADRLLAATTESERLAAFADKQLPTTATQYFQDVFRAAKAGFVGGTALGGPQALFNEVAEAGRRTAEMNQLAEGADKRTADRIRQAEELAGLPSLDEAFSAAEATRPSEQDIQDELEAGFRTMELTRQAEQLAQSNPMAAGLLNSGATTVTPEQIRAEREAAAEAAKPAWQRSVEQVQAQRTSPAVPLMGAGTGVPAPQAPRRRGRRSAAAVAADTAEATPSTMTAEQLRQAAGLSMNTDTRSDLTAGGVIRAVRDKLGPKNVNVVGKLMRDGNLVVVDDVSEIPGDANEAGAGFYDGNKTYIVANRVNPENLIGDVLAITAHEVKHAADVGGEAIRPYIGEFIGEKANAALNKKIEAAAAGGNQAARAAVEAARAGSTPETYALELPAYFINAQLENRNQQGVGARIAGNIVSAVRTAYKRAKGGDIDVNINDVAYMADRLTEEAALNGQPMRGSTAQPLAMVMGQNAPGFEQAKAEGRTFQDIDGAEKFVTSDADSTVIINPSIERTLESGNSIQAKFLLRHPELYKQYPKLGEAEVYVDPSMSGLTASYSETANQVVLSRTLWDRMKQDDAGRDIGRGLLLHELQHGIQGLEDFARGGSPDQFMTEEQDKQAKNLSKAVSNLRRYVDRLKNGQGLPPNIKDSVSFTAQNVLNGNLSLREGVLDILDDMEGASLSSSMASIAADMRNLTETATELGPKVTAAQKAANEKYLRLRGEQESYFVQDARNTRQEDLPVDPTTSYQGEPIVDKTLSQKISAGSAPLAVNLDSLRRGMQKMKEPSNFVYTSLIDYTGGLGRELAAKRENADGEAALYSHRAMNAYANIEQQIKNMGKRGVKEGRYKNLEEARKSIREDLRTKLDAIAKLPTIERRESALASLIRENPYYAPAADAISQINQLSKTLLAQMIQSNPNPTAAELKRMTTLAQNMFSYSTRMYAAFQGKPGRKHSERLIADYDAANEALAKGKDVNSRQRENFTIYRNAMKYLIDNDLNIPQDDTIYDMKTDKINNLYDTWVGDSKRARQVAIEQGLADGMTQAEAREFATETLIDALQQRAAPVQAEYESKARDIINGMLGLKETAGPIANYYRGFRQDRSILEERERVPEEIKQLFGEITDPATRLAVTIAKQGELAARTRLLLDMRDSGVVIPAAEAGLPGTENYSVSLDGATFGPLDGYRATPEVGRAISENLEMYTSFADSLSKSYVDAAKAGENVAGQAIKGLQWAAGKQKLVSIALEPFGILMNGLGSPIMLAANGVTSPTAIAKGVRTGLDSIVDTAVNGRGELSPDLEEAIRYGILDSARVQEIRRTPQKFVRQLVNEKPEAVNAAARALGTTMRTTVETFAIADAWVKVAAFKDRTDALTKFYAAEGVNKSEEDIKQEAADTIKDTNITYGRTAPGIRLVESTGWTSFLPYFASVPRSLAYNTVVAYKDFIRAKDAKTMEGKMALGIPAMKRLAGTTAATAGIVYGMQALAAAVNGEDEERMNEAKKVLRPDARFADSIYLGEDKKGNPMFFRLSRIDPYGPVNDIFRILVDDSITTEQATKYAGDQLKDMLFTNRLTSSAASLVGSLITDDEIKDNETKLERIAPASTRAAKEMMLSLGVQYDTANAFIKVLDTMTPGWFDTLDPNNPKVNDPKDGAYEVLGDMVRWAGGRLDKADPGSYAAQLGKEIKDAKKEGRKRIDDAMRSDASAEEVVRVVQDSDNEIFDKMSNLREVYEGMINGLGYSKRKADEVLKEKASLTSVDTAHLSRGRIKTDATDDTLKDLGLTLSKSSLEQRAKFRANDQTDEEQKKEKEKREKLIRELKALGYKVGE